MLKISITLSTLVATLIMIGCGSTSSGSGASQAVTETIETTETSNAFIEQPSALDTTNREENSMAKITGSVPGTLIEAFCVDGSYYSTQSDQNGSAQHPFTLNIPQNLECNLVMTTNENDPATRVITPIAMVTPDSNSSSFVVNGTTLNLGYIDLAMSPATIVDANGDQVVDQPLPVRPLEGNLTTPPTTQNILDRNQNGIIDLFDDDDEDGIPNRDDADHNRSNDFDGDGIDNQHDKDDDNDGLADTIDRDDNNDGIEDTENQENNQSTDNAQGETAQEGQEQNGNTDTESQENTTNQSNTQEIQGDNDNNTTHSENQENNHQNDNNNDNDNDDN